MKNIILGGGLSGLSLAHFLNEKSIVLEKEKSAGGLCGSFNLNGIFYDIGPHIFFSKNEQTLRMLTSFVPTNKLKRSNKIYHKGKFIKYPFENDLGSLPKEEKEYCLKEFLSNPYENYEAKNMLQFFLKTFGEGITRLYLQPYNEKIWKMDPSFMDTQMVERIPKPPKEDVIKSANGMATEGYRHQLYFYYPKRGGTRSLIKQLEKLLARESPAQARKSEIISGCGIREIKKAKDRWMVKTDKGTYEANRIINCMPLHELGRVMKIPGGVKNAINNLKYNSIYIAVIQCKKDSLRKNFAISVADKDVIFHRLSKLNFLGSEYRLPKNGSTIMAEVTFRPGGYLDKIGAKAIEKKIIDDLDRLRFVRKKDIIDTEIKKFRYAYVVYDLNHRKNVDFILKYLKDVGVDCCGRFAEFEYLNMDAILDHSYHLAQEINKTKNGTK